MNGIHDVDEVLHITALEPAEVYCNYDTFGAPVDVEDFAVANITFQNGAIGSMEVSSCTDGLPNKNPPRMNKIYGEEGSIVVGDSLWLQTHDPTEDDPAKEWHEVGLDGEEVPSEEPATAFIRQFLRSLRKSREPPVTREECRQTMAFMQAAYKSGRLGEPVEV
jgi:predicted dehydrogenase